jgi:hypothetical protein
MNQETITQKHYEFLKELIATINRFPKQQRFLIGDKMQTIGMTILEREQGRTVCVYASMSYGFRYRTLTCTPCV